MDCVDSSLKFLRVRMIVKVRYQPKKTIYSTSKSVFFYVLQIGGIVRYFKVALLMALPQYSSQLCCAFINKGSAHRTNWDDTLP